MASGSCAPTTTSAQPSAQSSATRARSSSSRTATACWPASASKTAAPPKRMDAVGEHLATKHGIVVQQPAYSRYYLNLGEISSYPPGYKENAGIFCHVNPWVMIGGNAPGPRRQGTRLLHPHQSLGARRDQRPAPLRALCLCADDRRQGRAHLRRSQKLLAYRHRRVELLRHRAVDSGHPRHL